MSEPSQDPAASLDDRPAPSAPTFGDPPPGGALPAGEPSVAAPDAEVPSEGIADAPSLQDSLRRLRLGLTERADVLADLRETERARLEILNDSLEEMRAEIPEDVDYFTFELAGGETPRLWIDATTHVHMGRDRRTYRLVKDTRLGRETMAESTDALAVANAITDYVAERILDREQALEADWRRARALNPARPAPRPAAPLATAAEVTPGSREAVLAEVADLAARLGEAPTATAGPAVATALAPNATHPQALAAPTTVTAAPTAPVASRREPREGGFWFGLFMFLLGAAVGAVGLIAYGVTTGSLVP